LQTIKKPSTQVCGGLSYLGDEQSISTASMTPHCYANGKPVSLEYRKYAEKSSKSITSFMVRARKQISVQNLALSTGLPILCACAISSVV